MVVALVGSSVVVVAPAVSLGDQASPSAWSAPATVPGSTRTGVLPTPGAGQVPALAFAPTGKGVVTFSGGGLVIPVPPAPPTGTVLTLAAPITADTVGAAAELTPALLTNLVTDGPDSLLATLRTTGAGAAHGRPAVASVTSRPTLGRPRVIGVASESVVGPVTDARGDAAVLLEEPCSTAGAGCPGARLLLAVRRTGGAFGKPALLAGAANHMTPALAIGPTGDVLVAWGAGARSSRMLARFRFASGRTGPVKTLGPALTAGTVSAALGARDRAIVGWGSGVAGIDGAVTPTTFRVALARPGGRFAAARTVDRWDAPGTRAGTPIDVAVTAAGRGLVAWQGRTGANFAIDTARTNGTLVGSTQTISAGGLDAALDGLATGPGGAALVLWSRQQANQVPDGIYAATAATPTAAFTAPELVAPATGTYGARAAFDPLTRRAVAVWYTTAEQTVAYAVRNAP